MTAKEVQETVAFSKTILVRLKTEPDLADQFIAAIDKRVLTEQPEETPKERYERLFFSKNGNGDKK